jgi:hypothetical protein
MYAQPRLVGPTIFQVSPMLNGKSFNRYRYAFGLPDNGGSALTSRSHNRKRLEMLVERFVYYASPAKAERSKISEWATSPFPTVSKFA